jgi:hypothetical protein
MDCAPTASELVLRVAVPEERVAVPICVPLSLKVMLPVGVPLADEVTLAVNFTLVPTVMLVADAWRLVVVADAPEVMVWQSGADVEPL